MKREGVYICPYCGSEDTQVIEDIVEADSYYERWECDKCHDTWWEEYELIHKETTDHNGNKIDNDEECE